MVNQLENYCTNVDEIIKLAEEQLDDFEPRGIGEKFEFSTQYGDSRMKSLFHFKMKDELKDAIFKTIPEKRITVDKIVINRYEPGDYLVKHTDHMQGCWKFNLVFLRCDKPHLKWYDEDNKGHLVDEIPGALFEMPITTPHEVTEIGQDERPKYSLVLIWGE